MKKKTRKMLASLAARVAALDVPLPAGNPGRMDWLENRLANLEERLMWLEKNQPAPKDQFVTEAGIQIVHPDAHSMFGPPEGLPPALDPRRDIGRQSMAWLDGVKLTVLFDTAAEAWREEHQLVIEAGVDIYRETMGPRDVAFLVRLYKWMMHIQKEGRIDA